MSATQSVADTAFGFTRSELQILRSQQELHQQQPSRGSAMVERGRGTSRHSQPSSRAASAASSQSQTGRIVLEPRSLLNLQTSLDHLIRGIEDQIVRLESATTAAVQDSADRTANTVREADNEIERLKRIIKEIDRLEKKIEEVKRIREVIRQLRVRVEAADARLNVRTAPPVKTVSHHSPQISDRYQPRGR